jgi:arylsulfatase A-like enzyme
VGFILSQKGSFRLFFLYLVASTALESCIEVLAKIGQLDNIAIFVTSDNGAPAETVRLVRRQGAHAPRPAEHRQVPRGPR